MNKIGSLFFVVNHKMSFIAAIFAVAVAAGLASAAGGTKAQPDENAKSETVVSSSATKSKPKNEVRKKQSSQAEQTKDTTAKKAGDAVAAKSETVVPSSATKSKPKNEARNKQSSQAKRIKNTTSKKTGNTVAAKSTQQNKELEKNSNKRATEEQNKSAANNTESTNSNEQRNVTNSSRFNQTEQRNKLSRITLAELQEDDYGSKNLFGKVYSWVIADRLSVGMKMTRFSLDSPVRSEDAEHDLTFLGTISTLEEKDDTKWNLSVKYRLCKFLSFEYTKDEVAAYAWNTVSDRTDGSVKMNGPIYTLMLHYPFWKNRIIPFIGIGYAPWKSDFTEDLWWGNGWQSPEEYEQYGKDGKIEGRNRRMLVENLTATVYSAGVTFRLCRNAELELMMRTHEIEPTAMFYYKDPETGNTAPKRYGEFTLDNTSYGVALRAVF